jgi:histidinol-phosphatase
MQGASNTLQIAIDAVKIGASVALSYFDTNIKAELKADETIITIADTKTEDTIKAFIRSKDPGARFVAEESGGDPKEPAFWVIDPIDGTRSFSRGIQTWCILVAYYTNNETLAGVCYFPVLNQLLYAEKGKGAYLNDTKVTVSQVRDMKRSLAAYGSLRHFKDKQIALRLTEACGATRSPDTTYAALLTATGKMDILVDEYSNFWDVAPFLCIIPEAGGKITNLHGTSWTPRDRGYIMSNTILHDEIVDLVNKKV